MTKLPEGWEKDPDDGWRRRDGAVCFRNALRSYTAGTEDLLQTGKWEVKPKPLAAMLALNEKYPCTKARGENHADERQVNAGKS